MWGAGVQFLNDFQGLKASPDLCNIPFLNELSTEASYSASLESE